MPNKPFCILLTGMPNSGKSTIAYGLVQKRLRNALVIDGDKHREMQFLGKLDFTKDDIMKNTDHVIKMARFAQNEGFNVIIAQIAPYAKQRNMMRKALDGFIEVFCKCSFRTRAKRPNFKDSKLVYQKSTSDLIIDTERKSIDECIERVLSEIP